MPKAKDVWPKKWQSVIVLFDNGEYSVCWGVYERSPMTMGKRWNDNYPRQGSSPTWYIEYDFFIKSTIKSLIFKYDIEAKENRISDEDKEYFENCKKALIEYEEYKKLVEKGTEDLPF